MRAPKRLEMKIYRFQKMYSYYNSLYNIMLFSWFMVINNFACRISSQNLLREKEMEKKQKEKLI